MTHDHDQLKDPFQMYKRAPEKEELQNEQDAEYEALKYEIDVAFQQGDEPDVISNLQQRYNDLVASRTTAVNASYRQGLSEMEEQLREVRAQSDMAVLERSPFKSSVMGTLNLLDAFNRMSDDINTDGLRQAGIPGTVSQFKTLGKRGQVNHLLEMLGILEGRTEVSPTELLQYLREEDPGQQGASGSETVEGI